MDNQEAAYRRKNHVVSESSSRLRSLTREDQYGKDEGEELKSPVQQERVKVPKKENYTVKDPGRVRLFGFVNIVLMLLMVISGAFVCFVLNDSEIVKGHPLLFSFFNILKIFKFHECIHLALKKWKELPEDWRSKSIKVLTYATLTLNLYPVLSGAANSFSRNKAETEVVPEGSEEPKDILIPTARLLSGLVLCIFIGYDTVYNGKKIRTLITGH